MNDTRISKLALELSSWDKKRGSTKEQLYISAPKEV